MITTSVIVSFADSSLIHDFKISSTAFKGAVRKNFQIEIFVLSVLFNKIFNHVHSSTISITHHTSYHSKTKRSMNPADLQLPTVCG